MPCERNGSSCIYDLSSFFWNTWIYQMSFCKPISNIFILYSYPRLLVPLQSSCATLLWVGCIAGMLPGYPSGSPTKYWAYSTYIGFILHPTHIIRDLSLHIMEILLNPKYLEYRYWRIHPLKTLTMDTLAWPGYLSRYIVSSSRSKSMATNLSNLSTLTPSIITVHHSTIFP